MDITRMDTRTWVIEKSAFFLCLLTQILWFKNIKISSHTLAHTGGLAQFSHEWKKPALFASINGVFLLKLYERSLLKQNWDFIRALACYVFYFINRQEYDLFILSMERVCSTKSGGIFDIFEP